MRPETWWYVARAGGVVAWVLATLAVVWGLGLVARVAKRPRPAWVLDLHRFLGGLTVTFVAIHVLGLTMDSTVHFGRAEVLVPFASTWRPAAVAAGVVAMYLLVAVEVSSLVMRRIPRRVWRAVHLGSYAVFLAGTTHAFTAGTDAGNPWFRGFGVVASVTVGGLTLLRALRRGARRAPPRARAAAATRTAVARP